MFAREIQPLIHESSNKATLFKLNEKKTNKSFRGFGDSRFNSVEIVRPPKFVLDCFPQNYIRFSNYEFPPTYYDPPIPCLNHDLSVEGPCGLMSGEKLRFAKQMIEIVSKIDTQDRAFAENAKAHSNEAPTFPPIIMMSLGANFHDWKLFKSMADFLLKIPSFWEIQINSTVLALMVGTKVFQNEHKAELLPLLTTVARALSVEDRTSFFDRLVKINSNLATEIFLDDELFFHDFETDLPLPQKNTFTWGKPAPMVQATMKDVVEVWTPMMKIFRSKIQQNEIPELDGEVTLEYLKKLISSSPQGWADRNVQFTLLELFSLPTTNKSIAPLLVFLDLCTSVSETPVKDHFFTLEPTQPQTSKQTQSMETTNETDEQRTTTPTPPKPAIRMCKVIGKSLLAHYLIKVEDVRNDGGWNSKFKFPERPTNGNQIFVSIMKLFHILNFIDFRRLQYACSVLASPLALQTLLDWYISNGHEDEGYGRVIEYANIASPTDSMDLIILPPRSQDHDNFRRWILNDEDDATFSYTESGAWGQSDQMSSKLNMWSFGRFFEVSVQFGNSRTMKKKYLPVAKFRNELLSKLNEKNN